MKFLAGKTALVTGASRGIGRTAALALIRAGAQVIVHHGRDAHGAEKLVDEIRYLGGRSLAIGIDLASADGPARLACQVHSIVGDRLDILVCGADATDASALDGTTVEDFDALLAGAVRAPYFLVQQLLPILRQCSSVTLLSSSAAHAGTVALCAHAAAAGAVTALVRHLGSALGARGIRVNAVASGAAQTTGQTASSENVAAVVAFLASDQARWTTGAVVRADAGSSADTDLRLA